MKIIYLLSAILTLTSITLHAQDTGPERRFEAGVVAGMNLSQIDGDDLTGFNKIGVNVGARVDAILTERWRLSLEMLFAQQGASRHKLDNPASAFDKIRLNLVEAPVMVHFQDWKIQASAGVSYARVINAEVIDYTGEDATESYPLQEDLFSIILGGTFFFQENLGINIQWSRWLNNLLVSDGNEPSPLPGQQSGRWIGRTVTIRGIYMF
ncbi:MAG: outer membrane beta-barrel protein [Lewinellaceae bacterium]|nr:outer membrane beta-barrel protein [Phaeodactylibacter sp.]MCB0612028.1 outer membrane beta-barrel protein [Phaeodactylibacter sp.]MCB9348747.1 outer membrane beta-barrel protein [Lewinellaceae bacterium]